MKKQEHEVAPITRQRQGAASAELCSDAAAVELFVRELFEKWKRHHRKVSRYVEPTVQLLQREGYSQVGSVWMIGCDLVAACPGHWLIGYVCVHEWPTAEEIEMVERFPAPAATRRVIFRWHCPKGFPDRKQL